jgi:CopG family transcriptional regulator/antitoxin EndoAI
VNHDVSREWFAMTKSRSDVKVNGNKEKEFLEKKQLNTMKKGYQEMAEINLSISKLYFEVESEAESYYDRIAECE